MMSLFSSFNFNTFQCSFILSFTILIVASILIVYENSMMNLFMKQLISSLETHFLNLMSSISSASKMTLSSVFMYVLTTNLTSTSGFFFAVNTQMSTILYLSLTIWLSVVIFWMINSWKTLIIHMTPEGSPMGLALALFVIELVSSIIRPITLSVRLIANTLSGHVMLILIHSALQISSMLGLTLTVMTGVEMAVALIQSYIFITLVCLYIQEVE